MVKSKILYFIIISILTYLYPPYVCATIQNNFIPVPKEYQKTRSRFFINDSAVIVADSKNIDTAKYLEDKIFKITGKRMRISEKRNNGEQAIILNISGDNFVPKNYELYDLTIETYTILINAQTKRGVFNGIQTLLHMLNTEAARFYFPGAKIHDYPTIKNRALYLSLTDDLGYFKEIIDKAAFLKFNTLIIRVDDMVKYDSHPEMSNKNAIEKMALKDIVDYAKSRYFKVIPAMQLLTHQQTLFKKKYPSLMLNEYTYDPSNEMVYKIAFDIMAEIINIFEPEYFHIGHDEVWGVAPNLAAKNPERILSPDMFAGHINKVYLFLKQKEIKTMIWGDMFLVPPDVLEMGRLSVIDQNNFRRTIDLIPRDVIINDWHYYENNKFPSVDYFQSKGFKVWGATWNNKDNIFAFSSYISRLKVKPSGMIATTWFNVGRRASKSIDNILEWSAQAYWSGGYYN